MKKFTTYFTAISFLLFSPLSFAIIVDVPQSTVTNNSQFMLTPDLGGRSTLNNLSLQTQATSNMNFVLTSPIFWTVVSTVVVTALVVVLNKPHDQDNMLTAPT